MSSQLKLRFISGVTLASVIMLTILFARPLFHGLIVLSLVLMLSEWHDMARGSPKALAAGLIFVPLPVVSILLISELDPFGWLIITYIAIISMVDTGAMFGGKILGGPKLAPKISPKKTISGLFTGALAASMVPVIFSFLPTANLDYILPDASILHLSLLAFLLAFISQASDLLVSIFKRHFKIKDTSSLIPGHGGVLDRVDSYILTAPLVLSYIA